MGGRSEKIFSDSDSDEDGDCDYFGRQAPCALENMGQRWKSGRMTKSTDFNISWPGALDLLFDLVQVLSLNFLICKVGEIVVSASEL